MMLLVKYTSESEIFVNYWVVGEILEYCMSSPFYFMFGDDCVIYHTRADDIPGDVVDA